MNNEQDHILFCHGLTKSYTDGNSTIDVLRHIDLTVAPSEMVSIVGISGSGKSTLLHLLGGLDKPTSGHIFLKGRDLHKLPEKTKCQLRNQYLGFVYQFHHLLPEFSALENVSMPLLIGKTDPTIIEDKAAHLLKQVGLENRVYHRLGQLSGGERQRVAIARALVSNPLCVLADEPTGNLDPHNAGRVLDLFLHLQELHKTSVVIVTHDPNIAKHGQRMMRIEAGRLIQVA